MRRGKKAEKRACNYLKEKGFRVLGKNYHCRVGEIDLIALDRSYLVFVEVKKRQKGSLVSPEEAVTEEKKDRIIFCSKCWIMEHNYKGDIRYDVVTICGDRLRHYKGAFTTR